MQVKIEVSPEHTPPRAVIYTDRITPEIQRALDILQAKDTPVLAERDGRTFLLSEQEVYMIRVPCDSPINNTGILFYNTLFDENASCHLALGRGFENCVEGFENMTQEQLRAMGVNDSMIHVDFMIGAPDLDITGILPDGTRVPVFRNGEWCF